MGLLQKLQKTLQLMTTFLQLKTALMTTCKAFVRPNLDYGNVIYDEAYNKTFHQKRKPIQYNACLALSGAIR